jgi:hypothetical protein
MATATVDLTRQRMQVTPLPGAIPQLPVEIWCQDAFVRSQWLAGMLRISFESNQPTNVRALWYDMGNPPTGLPGTLKRWDVYNQIWVPLTPDGFIDYMSVVARAKFWKQAMALDPAPADALPMDWWLTTDNRLSMFIPYGPGLQFWMDVTGAAIDVTALINLINSPRPIDGGTA